MMSTASKGAAEKDYVVRSEEDGEERAAAAAAEEELELGLSLGARKVTGGGGSSKVGGQWGEYRRILTAEDFPSLVSRASPRSSSSSSVSSSSPAVAGAGFKRAADSVSPPSQAVVGWPPIRAFRMNSLVNQSRENADATANKKTTNTSNSSSNTKEAIGSKDQEKRQGVPAGTSLFVKVNMDGDPIGRKVDLNAHLSYESLAAALEIMFHKPTTALATSFNGTQASKLLDGSSEFALTYEDKDGDWMLVGDVPWGMFLSTVKRLRIMRTSDAGGLAPRLESCRGNVVIRS